MFLEKRKQGKKIKYYLVHSYRVGDKVKRISRYLGSDLSEKQLDKLLKQAEALIKEQIKENPFEYELSKDEILAYKKFDSDLRIEHMQDWDKFTKDFTYNTNAIEGSTVLKSEVAELIDRKDFPENEDEMETLSVAEAIKFVRTTKEQLTLNLILKLHLICFKKTKPFAGKFRDVEVVIRDKTGQIIHQGAPANDIKVLLKDLVDWYDKHKSIYPPLLLAAVVHNQFEKIHPFQDGNGRVGRLLLNLILLKHKYPPVNIKYKDRRRYYRTLQEYDKSGDIKATLRFLISQYKK